MVIILACAGLYLHRLWQLGMEEEYYEGGVRPHLSVFYQSIKTRTAFSKITGWREQAGERRIVSSQDVLVDNARWGLGAAAVLGRWRADLRFSNWFYLCCRGALSGQEDVQKVKNVFRKLVFIEYTSYINILCIV